VTSDYIERLSKKRMFLYLMILAFLIVPDYFQTLDNVNTILKLITVFLFVCLLFFTVVNKRINFFIIFCFLFFLWRMFSSYYLSNGVLDIDNSIRIMSLVLLINLSIKKHARTILSALSLVFSTYIIINLITLLLYPYGLYLDNPREGQFRSAWLLGIDNQFAYFIIPGIVIVILSSLYTYKKITIKTWFVIIAAGITMFKVFSATGLVTILFVLGSVLLYLRKKSKLRLTFVISSIVYVVVWLLLVPFNSIDVFQSIIVDILGKDLTLSGRTRIWSVVLGVIPDSLWYGYGINIRVLVSKTYFVAHNMLLQITLESGIIGLFLFLFCIITAGIRLQFAKRYIMASLLVVGIFGILIGGLTEAYRVGYLFMLLAISYNIMYVVENKEN